MLDLLVLITVFAFAIPSLRMAHKARVQLLNMERRIKRLEAMHYDALLKLGYAADDIQAAYPRMTRFDKYAG